MNLENVIIEPLVTEKSEFLKGVGERMGKRMNQYTFKVSPMANKYLVKQAIVKIFNQKPDSVNIMNCRGKATKYRNIPSQKSDWKKAIVTFKDGAELTFGKGV
ncbi:MAG: 50S ribosomal protein L23 [Spirochaetota bacterium]